MVESSGIDKLLTCFINYCNLLNSGGALALYASEPVSESDKSLVC